MAIRLHPAEYFLPRLRCPPCHLCLLVIPLARAAQLNLPTLLEAPGPSLLTACVAETLATHALALRLETVAQITDIAEAQTGSVALAATRHTVHAGVTRGIQCLRDRGQCSHFNPRQVTFS